MKFRANNAGFAALRTSAQANALVREKAEKIEAAANAIPSTTSPAAPEPYYEAYDASDGNRARYRVATTGIRASRHVAKTFALERALSSG